MGVVGALGVQVIANVLAGRREDKRRVHEREIKRMELEDKKLQRLREERLKAYVGFAEMTKTVALANLTNSQTCQELSSE